MPSHPQHNAVVGPFHAMKSTGFRCSVGWISAAQSAIHGCHCGMVRGTGPGMTTEVSRVEPAVSVAGEGEIKACSSQHARHDLDAAIELDTVVANHLHERNDRQHKGCRQNPARPVLALPR